MQRDPGLTVAGGILVILGQFLPNLSRSPADDRIGVGIVVRRPPENLDPERALFE